jgi:hypothetical protein
LKRAQRIKKIFRRNRIRNIFTVFSLVIVMPVAVFLAFLYVL